MRIPMPARLTRFAAFLAAAVTLGHAVVFVTNHGAGTELASAMRRTGHDAYWTGLAIWAGLAVAFFTMVATGQVVRLWRLARAIRVGRVIVPDARPAGLVALLVRRWAWYGSLTILAFVAQENLEHLASGLGVPGLAVLGGSGYGGAFAILPASGLLAGLIDAILDWCRTVLVARIRAALRGRPRVAAVGPPAAAEQPPSFLAGLPAGRAPPSFLAA